jgi:hypothetical protein
MERLSHMNQFILQEGVMAQPEGERLFSVRLIDCRTGEVPSLNGIPLSVLTRAPLAAARSFMRGRNRRLWRTEVEPLSPK